MLQNTTLCLFTLTMLILLFHCHCESETVEDKEVANDLTDGCHSEKLRARKAGGRSRKVLPRNCLQCISLGLKKNGYCTLYDSKGNKFLAYCDITSEPGFAWTLVTSFSRGVVGDELSGVFKRKSLSQDDPVNENSPNWDAFRYSKQRMLSIKQVSTHMRITCSTEGPFTGLKDYDEYLRINFWHFNPFTFNSETGRCINLEFIGIRGASCLGCRFFLAQAPNKVALHANGWLTSMICRIFGGVFNALSTNLFGYYQARDSTHRCSKWTRSTTNIWFGSRKMAHNAFIKP